MSTTPDSDLPFDDAVDPDARIVEWFRIDAMRRVKRSFLIGITVVICGAVQPIAARIASAHAGLEVAPWTLDRRHPSAMVVDEETMPVGPLGRPWYGLAGASLVLGILTTIVGLQRVLSEERYLALRTDGALFVDGETQRFFAWSRVARIERDASTLVFVSHDDDRTTLSGAFAGVDHDELVRRANQVRRRALFGIVDRRPRSTRSYLDDPA